MICYTKPQDRSKKPSKRSIAVGSTVLTDVIRTAIVYNVSGSKLWLRYGRHNWPFPTEEIRDSSEVEVLDLIPERYAEEALM